MHLKVFTSPSSPSPPDRLVQSVTSKPKELIAAFGSDDIDAAIGAVLDKGEIQLSAEERDHKQDRYCSKCVCVLV